MLAPHYSRMSVGEYRERVDHALDGRAGLVFVESWHDNGPFLDVLADRVRGTDAHVVFTAHSLPARIIAEGDPYRDQLLESCRLVAAGMDLPPWELAFQSASQTGEPWLGPDLLEAIEKSGAQDALVCPIGFVADHLEILYDLDVEAQAFARDHGIRIRRTRSFNAEPQFIEALARIVADALEERVGAGTA